MARGLPDYGQNTSQTAIAGMSDLGELAARIWSPNTYDRRGYVVYMDDFEGPTLQWTPTILGAGVLPVVSSTIAWSGSQSVWFYCPAVAGSRSILSRRFPVLRTGKFGVEFWLAQSTISTAYLNIRIEVHDGIAPTRAELHLYQNERDIYLVDATGNVLIAEDLHNPISAHLFTPIKLVVDMDNDAYTRLLYEEQEVDISAYDLVAAGVSTETYISVVIQLFGQAGGISQLYMDNFILTQNEP